MAQEGGTSGEHFPNEKYITMQTFRRNGTPVATTVWFVDVYQDRLGQAPAQQPTGPRRRLQHARHRQRKLARR